MTSIPKRKVPRPKGQAERELRMYLAQMQDDNITYEESELRIIWYQASLAAMLTLVNVVLCILLSGPAKVKEVLVLQPILPEDPSNYFIP